jgi:hypothetical protein
MLFLAGTTWPEPWRLRSGDSTILIRRHNDSYCFWSPAAKKAVAFIRYLVQEHEWREALRTSLIDVSLQYDVSPVEEPTVVEVHDEELAAV